MENLDAVLEGILGLNGAIATSVVDWKSGMVLATAANKKFDIELASAGNSEVVKAKMATMASLGLEGNIQDILITLDNQIHIITVVPSNKDLFVYLALDDSANLALARNKMKTSAAEL